MYLFLSLSFSFLLYLIHIHIHLTFSLTFSHSLFLSFSIYLFLYHLSFSQPFFFHISVFLFLFLYVCVCIYSILPFSVIPALCDVINLMSFIATPPFLPLFILTRFLPDFRLLRCGFFNRDSTGEQNFQEVIMTHCNIGVPGVFIKQNN